MYDHFIPTTAALDVSALSNAAARSVLPFSDIHCNVGCADFFNRSITPIDTDEASRDVSNSL